MYLSNMLLLVGGDTNRASTLMVGAQHTDDLAFVFGYWRIKMMAGNFDDALLFAGGWSADWEIHRKELILREHLMAESLKAMGRDAEADAQAQQALSRLELMQQQGLDDYRLAAAKLAAYGILADTGKVSELVAEVMAEKPDDAVEDLMFRYMFAKTYAYSGMLDECLETLEALLSGYSTITVPWLELDPAFNGIRNQPEFIALLESHR
jgi:hypothetical protein